MPKRTMEYVCVVLVIVCLLAIVLALPVIRCGYTVERTLTFDQPEPILLLLRNAPLEQIAASVIRHGDVDCAWRGGSLLYEAVWQGRQDVVEWTLKHGANPNGVHSSSVPLDAALEKNDVRSIRLLLSHGADPDIPIRFEMTPRKVAVASGNAEVAELLRGAQSRPASHTRPTQP